MHILSLYYLPMSNLCPIKMLCCMVYTACTVINSFVFSGDMEVLLFIQISISTWYFVSTAKSYGKDERERKANRQF